MMFPENAGFIRSLRTHDHHQLKELGPFFLPRAKANISEFSFALANLELLSKCPTELLGCVITVITTISFTFK